MQIGLATAVTQMGTSQVFLPHFS